MHNRNHVLYQVGIMVNRLDMSQLSHALIRNVNKLIEIDDAVDVMCFYEDFGLYPVLPKFAVLHEREVWGLEGVVIATDLKTADRLISCPGPTHKYFYVWNFEWLTPNGQLQGYTDWDKVYNNPKLELIARNEDHAEALTKVWREPKLIMDDFDVNVLANIVKGH